MPVVDVHTHFYPDVFMDILRARVGVPYVRTFPDDPASGDRLVILPAEDTESTSRGRPIGKEYYDIREKLKFMDKHNIDISVISLANPWLDFVDAHEAAELARWVNDNMEEICTASNGRLFAFGTLPLSGSVEDIVSEVERLQTLKHMRGVIIGSSGCGSGLDDPALDPMYAALEQGGQTIFIHPHYGLPTSLYGPRANEYGHVLPLALGFPLETTIAVTRMYLSGIWDRFRKLNVLLAHSGGSLPFLAGRLHSCIEHDAHLLHHKSAPERSVFDVLKENIFLDAVIYDKIGLVAGLEASGADRVMFGTDHPFFPPLKNEDGPWLSVELNSRAIEQTSGADQARVAKLMGGNAVRLLKLA